MTSGFLSTPHPGHAAIIPHAQHMIGQLATELIHLIFSHLPLETLVLISQVCRRWRVIVLTHPTYTSVINLPVNATERRIKFFLLQASRATGCLQVDIDFSTLEGATSAPVVHATHRLFNRARTMRVVLDAETWKNEAHKLTNISSQRLEALHLGIARPLRGGAAGDSLPLQWRHGDWPILPSLRTLSLAGISLPSESSVPWLNHVTDLRLDGAQYDEAEVLDLCRLLRDFPTLSTLRAAGNFRILPPASTSIRNLQRLSLHTYGVSTLWPELQPHVSSVNHVEVGWLSHVGVDAIIRHLRTPVRVMVAIEPPCKTPSDSEDEDDDDDDDLGKIRFTSFGACGKTFSLVCGKPEDDGPTSDSSAQATTPPPAQDSPTHLDVDASPLARHTISLRIDVYLWDVACRTGADYNAVGTLTLVWPATACGQLMMPVSGICAYSRCSALKCLRLEREMESYTDSQAWVELEEALDFVRCSLIGVDMTLLSIESSGIDLV